MNVNAPTDELVENLDAILDVLVGCLKYERERAYRSIILQEITAGLKTSRVSYGHNMPSSGSSTDLKQPANDQDVKHLVGILEEFQVALSSGCY